MILVIGAGAHERVEAVLGEPRARFLVHVEGHALLLELSLQLDDELVDHVGDGAWGQ